ncbi:hypothetical protein D1007_04119 [Hordeum vulgare]|nr:hypothetical protein D1007_04119 [Hordeum vulgare]
MAQVVVNNQQQGMNDNVRSTPSEFLRNSPQTFTETAEPLDAHEWICIIEDLLALVNCNEDREKVLYASNCLGGTATFCWDGFKVIQGNRVITWTDFKQGLCIADIPYGIMAIKKRGF